MKKYKFTTILFLILFLSNFSFSYAQQASGINVDLHVGGTCNYNGICDPGEDLFNCAADCTPIIIPPPSNNSSGGMVLAMDNVFNNLTVEVSYHSAIIKWSSVIPTMSNVRWGTSQDYKNGVLKNINFLLEHRVEINNLQDGTTYYFNIQAENLLGKTNILDNQIFKTLSLADTTPPLDPKNIKAESNSSLITITWENPNDLDFDYVRVLRDGDNKKINPYNGKVVYEGRGQYFTDANVENGKEYFYSFFSRDKSGNYSKGVSVSFLYKSKKGTNLGGVIDSIIPLNELKTEKGFQLMIDSVSGYKIFGTLSLRCLLFLILTLVLLILLIRKLILTIKNKHFKKKS